MSSTGWVKKYSRLAKLRMQNKRRILKNEVFIDYQGLDQNEFYRVGEKVFQFGQT